MGFSIKSLEHFRFFAIQYAYKVPIFNLNYINYDDRTKQQKLLLTLTRESKLKTEAKKRAQ